MGGRKRKVINQKVVVSSSRYFDFCEPNPDEIELWFEDCDAEELMSINFDLGDLAVLIERVQELIGE